MKKLREAALHRQVAIIQTMIVATMKKAKIAMKVNMLLIMTFLDIGIITLEALDASFFAGATNYKSYTNSSLKRKSNTAFLIRGALAFFELYLLSRL